MALKKIAEYTFDNSVKDCLPIIHPSSISVTKEDNVVGKKTTRTLYIDESLFPVRITFDGAIELLTVEYLRIDSNIISLVNNFFNCTSLTSINTTGFDTSGVTSMDNMFQNCSSLTSADLSSFDTTKVNSMYNLFRGCTSLRDVNLSSFDTSNVTAMNSMFQSCSSLINVDITNFNTAKVTRMGGMFGGCKKITYLDLSNFDTNAVTNMDNMFSECNNLIDLCLSSNFNTKNVTSMISMFFGCSSLESVDLSSFETSKVVYMNSMFQDCKKLKKLDLSNFNTSSVQYMNSMFLSCTSLMWVNVSSFNTSQLKSMANMFEGCKSLTSLDLSSFTTNQVVSMNNLFTNSSSLTQVDLSNFKINNATTINMFHGANLKTVGVLYCDYETINKLSSATPSTVSPTYYYYEANESDLTGTSNVKFEKYVFPSTMQLPPHIQLHSLPNGVKDELDLKTGILTRNVGHIILDDSYEYSETIYNTTKENTIIMQWYDGVNSAIPNIKNSSVILCDRLPNREALGTDVEAIDCHGTSSVLHFNISKDRLKGYESTFNGVKKYLGDNPLSVYYQLETPTTEKIILNYNNSCDYAIKLPTGAVDKYDVVNSLYTQNVNSILLDGSNSWESLEDLGTTIKFTAIGSSVGIDNLNMKGSGGLYCDNGMFPNINDDSDVEHCRVDKEGNKFYFFVNRTRLMSPDLIGWQYWLISNSFTLYYERNESETYSKLYEELDPTQASWEMLDCIRGGEVAHDTNGTNGITLYPTMEYIAPSINNFNISVLEPTTEYTIYAKNTNSKQTLNLGGVTHSFTDGSKYLSGETQWVTFNGCDTVDEVVIIKGDTTNDYVPYFTGMQSVKMPVLTTTGKNLFDSSKIIYNSVVNGNNPTSLIDNTERNTLDYIQVKPGERIIVSGFTVTAVYGYDANKNYVERVSGVSSTGGLISDNVCFIRIAFDNTIDFSKAQIEYGTQKTEYEPHKTNIITCNEEVELHGIGDVQDELDCLTGKLTQRIGEVVFDGGDDEEWDTWITEETMIVWTLPKSFVNLINPISDICIEGTAYGKTEEMFAVHSDDKRHIQLRLFKTTARNINELKIYLQSNPITVKYVLESPTIKTVNLQYNICAYEKLYRAISRTPSDIVHVQVSSEPNSLSPLLELECSTASASTENYATIENNIKFDEIDKATLKGRTLVNLVDFETNLVRASGTIVARQGNKITFTTSTEGKFNLGCKLPTLKPNTKYLLKIKAESSLSANVSFHLLNVTTNTYIISNTTITDTTHFFTTKDNVDNIRLSFHRGTSVGDDTVSGEAVICEYQDGMENWGIPYFTGVQSVETPILTTTNRINVFIENKEISRGYYNGKTAVRASHDYMDGYICDVEPNTTYSLYFKDGEPDTNKIQHVSFWNENTYISGWTTSPITFTTPTNCNKLRFAYDRRATDINPLFIPSNIVLSIGTGVVYDESFKSNTLSYNEEVILRGIGDVKDELNLLTGGLTQRVGEVVLDGSADEGWSLLRRDSITNVFQIPISLNIKLRSDLLSNLFDGKYVETIQDGVEVIKFNNSKIYVNISNTKATTVEDFKNYITQQPLIIQYQLATPISKVIDLTYINENNEELSYNYTTMTNSTYIALNGDTPITPNVVYALPSKNSFYLVNIKTGTRYTLKYPSGTGQISIGNLSYAVTGSSVLFMTPFEITGDKNAIVFSDEDPQDVILVEGDYSNIEVPYFTGIKSVENPVIEVYNKLTTETVQYKATSSVTLRSLPNGVADTLDIITGMLTQMINQRPYEEGDESLTDVWTDGENTIYGLTSPIIRNITFPTPIITSFSTIKVFSNHLIPQLKYRALSSNNFPLDLLQPNKTYTLYATVSNIGSYTLGGTYTGNFFGTTAISLGDVTSKSLIFNSDVGASNVMLIEGDTTKSTVPYFLGILSVEDIIMYIKGYKGEMNSMTLDDDVVLNGFGENRDIIDLTTGILTKKTNQIVLVGTENWIKFDDVNITDDYVLFRLNIPDLEASSVLGLKCDKFSHVYAHQQLHQSEGIYSISTVLNLCVKKSTIGGDNVTMLKLWLSRNNVKVVYPLATPVTIQLKNLWLSMPPTSYYTKTIIIDSTTGNTSLKPIFTATVATTALEEVVSNLETQNEQLEQENIATMLALTDMYEMMSMSMPMTMSLGDDEEIEVTEVTSIGMVYAKLINKGLKTIDQVPYFLQAEVKYALSQM